MLDTQLVLISLCVNTYTALVPFLLQVGVEIYVDAVINHMAAGQGTVSVKQHRLCYLMAKIFRFLFLPSHAITLLKFCSV